MKKFTTIFLVLIMIFSMSVSAFAEPDHNDEIILGAASDAPSWVKSAGRKVTNGVIVNYVSEDGTTSAVMPAEGICWVNCVLDGKSVWYGISNDTRTFDPGSRFWVKWIGKEENRKEYEELLNTLDQEDLRMLGNGSGILRIGVQSEDGSEYNVFSSIVMFYIQLGDFWSREDLEAQYIASGKDEDFAIIFKRMDYPSEGLYGIKLLKHFSEFELIGSSTSKVASVIGDGNVWMTICIAEFIVLGAAIAVLAVKLKRKASDANSTEE